MWKLRKANRQRVGRQEEHTALLPGAPVSARETTEAVQAQATEDSRYPSWNQEADSDAGRGALQVLWVTLQLARPSRHLSQ